MKTESEIRDLLEETSLAARAAAIDGEHDACATLGVMAATLAIVLDERDVPGMDMTHKVLMLLRHKIEQAKAAAKDGA